MDDHDLIMAARAAKNGQCFDLLWSGNWQGYYQHRSKPVLSQSEADLAFCSMLAFWSHSDAVQMDRIFRQSKLMRPKWDKIQGAKTYGAMTVDKAIALQVKNASSQKQTTSGSASTGTGSAPAPSNLYVVPLSSVTPVPLQWLWPGFIPLGKVSLLAGDPGLGKSQVSLDMGARVSTGAGWPTGTPNVKGRVILISAEDDPADTIVPRLIAAKADLSQIDLIRAAAHDQGGVQVKRALSLKTDLEKLNAQLAAHPDTRLVIVDPVSAYLGDADSHNNAEVRALLDPLADVAQRNGVAILLVSHLNKGGGAAMYRISGSIGFAAVARAVFGIVKDDADDKHRLMLPVKANLSKDSQGLGYRIRSTPSDIPYIEWDQNIIVGDALDAYLVQSEPGEAGRLKEACDWLQHELAGGPTPSKDILSKAKKDGISPTTLERAKKKLGVGSRRQGDKWVWCPPATQIPGMPISATAAGFGSNIGSTP